MSRHVTVYLDREALARAVLTLLLPVQPTSAEHAEATATEVDGHPENPAILQRVHRHVQHRLNDPRRDREERDHVLDELAGLFGVRLEADHSHEDVLTAEADDPEADREVAHRIITALAAVFPLTSDQLASLPVGP
ncbi:hypothetical protein PV726_31955 [Streptomyces europaeiscabiei]|uniref:hypothetical protein n=1 Tax=Streptomyces europaeiscabiei TaxID=146819 RepID=UPI0029B57951|nr:hypothetical protein [Streptomyces europaeiscabiei]MDX3694870.1 hypothetical protein [Streptomyces europaeiscabiei]